ncbi:S49 family peptidase [Oceaniradius stylonematis]|uniref:S49 family peptidase n=1 Tax=Oceaniradius stylonematis TaxID=2184161 RepID=UPI003B591409
MPDLDIATLVSRFLGPLSMGGGARQLWAIDRDGIRSSLMTVESMRGQDAQAPAASRRGSRYGKGTFMSRVGSIAVVPVMGPLTARMSWCYWSYDEIIRDLRLAEADDTIDAILLDVDSPGGVVFGVESAASEIARINADKPVVAHVGGLGASAAYWLAASASEIVAAPSSIVGSVGSLIRYMDIEGMFTRLGANIVEVLAQQSPNKRLDPDSEEGRAEMQALVDNAAELFLEGLAEARSVDRDTLIADYGQGLVFNAGEALSRGLIDQVASFEDTLAALAGRAADDMNAGAATAHTGQETIMAKETNVQGQQAPAGKPVTVESLRAEHGDLVATIESEAATAAVAAERDRVKAIQAHAKPGRETLIASMIADGTAATDAATKILAAIDAGEIKAEETSAAASTRSADDVLTRMDAAAEGVASTVSAGAGVAPATTEDGWKAEYESSAKLQAEYPNAESYVALKKREARRAA